MPLGIYQTNCSSPLGKLTLASDGENLVGLWIEQQKYYGAALHEAAKEQDLPVFRQTQIWLEDYFSGEQPNFMPPLATHGTPFQEQVWEVLREIPYGQTITYGQIAKKLAQRTHKPVSAQAVGGAVGRNPISILIPCHRIIGANGSLTGYAGGVEKKQFLLALENSSPQSRLKP